MGSENQIDKSSQPRDEAEVKTSEGRRKLIRGALIGAPVLLALKSTPVLACNCKLPSGFSSSGNLSQTGGATCTQPARKPSSWKYHIDSNNKFTNTGILKTTKFKDIFGGTDGRDFLTVLNSGNNNLAAFVTSAYLGTKAIPFAFVTGVSDLDIKLMWSGSYKPPGSSSNWSLAETENYLRYTMGLPLNP